MSRSVAVATTLGPAWEAARASGSSSPLTTSVLRLLTPALCIAAVIYVGVAGGTLVAPVLCQELLVWVADPDGDVKLGVAFVVALGGALCVSCLAQSYFELLGARAGAWARDAVCTLVFSKVMRLRLAGMGGGSSEGEIQRLLSVDAATLEGLVAGLVSLVGIPLELAGLMALLWMYVEWASIAGLGVLLACLGGAFALAEAMRGDATAYGDAAGRRLRDTGALLRDVRAAKMGAFEPVLAAAIIAGRREESRLLRRVGLHEAGIMSLALYSGHVVFIVAIAVFTAAMHRELTFVMSTFVVIVNYVQGRTFAVPMSLMAVESAFSSLARIDAFLLRSEEEAPLSVPPAATLQGGPPVDALAVELVQATVSWPQAVVLQHPSTTPSTVAQQRTGVLSGVDLALRHGELATIVGGTASGKTSLLMALLGEAPVVSGSAAVQPPPLYEPPAGWPLERVALVPQTPWIIAGASLRENVVMGRPWDAERYAACLAAVSLDIDAATMLAGDATPVSIATLSGGQAQRVSLARAAYSHAPLVLLDDCLSALDTRIAQAVLQRCILGEPMRGRTRVLVSHAAAAVAAADVVGVFVRSDADGTAAQRLVSGPLDLVMRDPAASRAIEALTGHEQGDGDVVEAAPGGAAAGPAAASADDGNAPRVTGAAALLEEAAAETIGARGLAADAPARLPFYLLWEAGIGGRGVAAAYFSLQVIELTLFLVANWLIVQWAEASEVRSRAARGDTVWERGVTLPEQTTAEHLGTFSAALGSAVLAAAIRQFVIVRGIADANDALHSALLRRLQRARVGFFDSMPRARLTGWLGAHLAKLDTAMYQHTEFFWSFALFLGEITVGSLVVDPWVLLPAALVGAAFCAVLFTEDVDEGGEADDEQGEGGGGGERTNDGGGFALDSAAAPVPTGSLLTDGPRSRRRPLGSAPLASHDADEAAPLSEKRRAAPSSGLPWCSCRRQVVGCGERTLGGDAAARVSAARVALDLHVASSLEGAVSLRAAGAVARAQERYGALLDAHAAAWLRAYAGSWQRALLGALCGSAFLLGAAATVLGLRASGGPVSAAQAHYGWGITANEAGFILVQGSFASIIAVLVVQHYAGVEGLGRQRALMVWGAGRVPQEPPSDDADASGDAEADAFLRPLCAAMAPPPSDGPPSAVVVAQAPPQTPPPGWPDHGLLVIRSLDVVYGPAAPPGSAVAAGAADPQAAAPRPALRGVSLTVRPGAWVSVVGRTGAGKSSLVAAILRIVEPCGGSVTVDGADLAAVPLHALRRRIVSVPQEPLLLAGPLRRSLDPFGEHSDAALLEALRAMGWFEGGGGALAPHADEAAALPDAAALPGPPPREERHGGAEGGGEEEGDALLRDVDIGGPAAAVGAPSEGVTASAPLDAHVSERGSNLSRGRRQLLVLARAILARPRLALLDEAYGALSAEAAAAAHRACRAAFRGSGGCSVLAVTHHLEAAVDADWVVVLEAGEVAEQGPPAELLRRPGGAGGAGSSGSGGASLRGLVDALPSEAQRARVVAAALAAAESGGEGHWGSRLS